MRVYALLALLLWVGGAAPAQVVQSVYQDSLQNGWEDWSWATVNVAATAPVHGGTKSISVAAANWQAVYLHAPAPVDPASYTGLTFWVNGGATGGQVVQVQGTINNVGQTAIALAPMPTNAWRQVTVSLAGLGFTNGVQVEGFWLQVPTVAAVPTFYVDDVSFTGPPPTTNPPAPIAVLIDAAADRHAISPLIYGVNLAGSNALLGMNAPLNRHGGNQTSRYNWKTNASNHAQDWYYQSLPEDGSGPGGAVDLHIRESRDGAAQPMITIPINGWVAKLGPAGQRLCSFATNLYGAQTDTDWEWFPAAGNGISAATGLPITNNNPLDANQPATTNYQAEWVQHLTGLWGSSTQGGVRYYIMDNEWAIWHETHRDVHPVGVTMDQSRDLFCSYAGMVKNLDPAAQIVGPEEYGWSCYLYSGYDVQWGNAHGWGGALPDRTAHGGAPMMPWWLNQVRQRSEAEGRRLLDVFTLHFYPQSGEFSDNVSAGMQALRNRSTRSLWDTNYVDESWINDRVGLAPLMKAWVASNYPGTRIGITEYSWGADTHMNGATAQADVLGILGREGVDLATRWVAPAVNSAAYRAFQMFRNYDGARSTFGDVSVRAVVPNPDQVAVFAAEQSEDGGLTVVAINKQPAAAAALALTLTNFTALGVAKLWQFASNQPITRLADRSFTNTLAYTLPPQSITTLVLPGAPRLDRAEAAGAQSMRFQLHGAKDLTYVIEASTNLLAWQARATNQLASNAVPVVVSSTNRMEAYRVRWAP